MTRNEAIAELVRIWHSPHLDLSLKAGLAEVIDTLKESNLNDSLVTDSSDDCKESESKLDLISRQDAVALVNRAIRGTDNKEIQEYLFDGLRKQMWALPSAELRKVTQEFTQDLISRQDALCILKKKMIDRPLDSDRWVIRDIAVEIKSLPSAEPQPKPISYIECANAMLKMWIDNVLTDGEYYRIMGKLNSKHMADMRGGDDSEID